MLRRFTSPPHDLLSLVILLDGRAASILQASQLIESLPFSFFCNFPDTWTGYSLFDVQLAPEQLTSRGSKAVFQTANMHSVDRLPWQMSSFHCVVLSAATRKKTNRQPTKQNLFALSYAGADPDDRHWTSHRARKALIWRPVTDGTRPKIAILNS